MLMMENGGEKVISRSGPSVGETCMPRARLRNKQEVINRLQVEHRWQLQKLWQGIHDCQTPLEQPADKAHFQKPPSTPIDVAISA